MHSSLAWIEWLDRLDRVLRGARADLASYGRSGSHGRLATLQAARRQLEVLLEQLQWMDPRVLARESLAEAEEIVEKLRLAVGTAILRLSHLPGAGLPREAGDRDELLTIDHALRRGRYAASHVVA